MSEWKESSLKMDIQLPSSFCEYLHFIFKKKHLGLPLPTTETLVTIIPFPWGEMSILATGLSL